MLCQHLVLYSSIISEKMGKLNCPTWKRNGECVELLITQQSIARLCWNLVGWCIYTSSETRKLWKFTSDQSLGGRRPNWTYLNGNNSAMDCLIALKFGGVAVAELFLRLRRCKWSPQPLTRDVCLPGGRLVRIYTAFLAVRLPVLVQWRRACVVHSTSDTLNRTGALGAPRVEGEVFIVPLLQKTNRVSRKPCRLQSADCAAIYRNGHRVTIRQRRIYRGLTAA